MEWLAPFHPVSHSAPLRVFLEAAGQEPPPESGRFLHELETLEDLEASAPWERSWEIWEAPDGQPPADGPEPPPETFGARALRERAQRLAAEAELARTGEPALPCCPCKPLTAEEKKRRDEQAEGLRKRRARLIARVPEETALLCRSATAALEQLQVHDVPVMRCGSEGVYCGKGSEVHAAVWLRAPEAVSSAARQMSLVLCVDTSGSMRQDLPVVRSVLTKLVQRADTGDQLSIITFNSTAKLELGWTRCDGAGKRRLLEVVDGLSAEGRTAFKPPLELLFEQVRGTKSRPVQIVLLSDGRPDDTSYYICGYLRRHLPPLDVALCTLGFGEKSDAKLLSQLSHLGRGHYIHVSGTATVGSAVGRLFAWAQNLAGECFLALRALGGCKILDLEEAFGCVRLKDGARSCLVLLGTLCYNQRRAVALRLALPDGTRAPLQDLNTPLAECTFMLRPAAGDARGFAVARCDLRALQVPSLLVEGLLGFPLRVYLKDDLFQAFDEERQQRLRGALCAGLAIPPSALVVDRVREGSVVIDARVQVPPFGALALLKRLNLPALEKHLREEGFAVGHGTQGYVEVPGQLAAQRWLQWAAGNSAAERPLRSVSALVDLEAGPLGRLEPQTAGAVGQDLRPLGSRSDHWRLQFHAAHLRAFAADPEAHVSLRSYDMPPLRQGAQALDSRNGAPIRWSQIEPADGGGRGWALDLRWLGELRGPHWLVSVEPEGPGSEILDCFRRFDQNGDGVITPDELSRVLRAIDPHLWTQDRTDALLRVIDSNGDGKIQYAEFVAWLNADDSSWDTLRRDLGIGHGSVQRAVRRIVKVTEEPRCRFDGLHPDVYRVTVKGADMQGCPGMYGQCWVCLGLRDLSPVTALLEAQEGPGALLQFSPGAWIGWGTIGQPPEN